MHLSCAEGLLLESEVGLYQYQFYSEVAVKLLCISCMQAITESQFVHSIKLCLLLRHYPFLLYQGNLICQLLDFSCSGKMGLND